MVGEASPLRAATAPVTGNPGSPLVPEFIEANCASCHDDVEKKGGFDLTSLGFDLTNAKTMERWVRVHDRVDAGEMPPKDKKSPLPAERQAFVSSLRALVTQAEQKALAGEGRATQRRLNRYEYENALRDLLGAPWLQIRDGLPEDGEAFRFNKVGDALDVSYVNMARYLGVAEDALRQVLARQAERPESKVTRYYTREQRSFANRMQFSVFNTRPERATFPVLGTSPQPEVRASRQPITVGAADPDTREREAVGVVASSYEPIELRFEKFKAPVSGRYKLRVSAYSVWVGPGKKLEGKPDRWWIPDFDDVSPGRRPEPITLYSETPPRQLRRLGAFDVGTEPTVAELDVYLLAGETIRPDAVRFFRSRPSNWQNPLATAEGQPGVAFRWLEVEGPIFDTWPLAGHQLMFGDLPLAMGADKKMEVQSASPEADADRLLRGFLAKAYRRPVAESDVQRFAPVIRRALESGSRFADAMILGYTAVLCSPAFLCLEETPGALSDHAVASRLAFFLWNTTPDAELRRLADQGKLRQPAVLRAQTERLLNDPKARLFVDAFLDYWLDLRRIQTTSPDASLYNDYYLDDALIENALEETQLFFAELLRADLPARNLVASDFIFANERLAEHYRLPVVEGSALRRVQVTPESRRGGLLTQASVLKVTANGTTTSPVVRGAWVMERILGLPPSPPPPGTPAVEPDIRGASTIRQLLEKHRSQETCAGCHTRIDPAGFALESFDVMGAWRDKYRAIADGVPPAAGIGKGGLKFTFHYAQPVDSAGELWDGRKFRDIGEFKELLVTEEKQIARNLAWQLVTYATGAPVRFSDRPAVETMLERSSARGYGVRSLVHEIVQSELFLHK